MADAAKPMDGMVRMAHRNRHVADTPANERILRVLEALRTPRAIDVESKG